MKGFSKKWEKENKEEERMQQRRGVGVVGDHICCAKEMAITTSQNRQVM